MDALDLDGRLALVTGGSRGIGLAVARGLALAGATVVLVARDAQRLEQAVDRLVAEGLDVTGRARRVLGTNLDGVFATVAAFVPAMVERRSGRVVNLSACLGRMSGPGTAGGLAPYRVSKAAVNALTRNLSAELQDGRRGVLVDAVCPGHCATDMGGPDAPRTAEQGADTVLWLARRDEGPTGRLWEDRTPVPW
jgi:NAD(P)-dependent dehydrogenase (short-subunit alcohol dehydrogenase family)